MFIRSKVINGVTYHAIVRSYRDATAAKTPRHKTVVSLGRHASPLPAWTAERKRLARLDAALARGPSPVRKAALERSRTASARKVATLGPFALPEAAGRVIAPEFDGMPPVAVALAVGVRADDVERIRAVRSRPDLWAGFMAGEQCLGAAYMRTRWPAERRR